MLNNYEIRLEVEKLKLLICSITSRIDRLEELAHRKPMRDMWGIGYGDKYIATDNKHFYYSDDGIYWSRSPQEYPDISFTYFAYGNGTYLVATRSNKIYYSHDGINWDTTEISIESKTTTSTYNPDVRVIKFCGDKFIAVSGSSASTPKLPIYSTDGVNWSECKFEDYDIFTNEFYNNIAYNNKYIVATGSGTYKVVYTEDGINWRVVKDVGSSGWSFVAYGNGKFVASWYDGGDIWYAERPDSWTKTEEKNNVVDRLVFIGNRFLAYVAQTSTNWIFKSSLDGNIWKEEPFTGDAQDVTTARRFSYIVDNLAAGSNYIAKYNGNWDVKNSDENLHRLEYIGGKYYMCCDYLLVSNNGVNWQNYITCSL